MKIKKEHVLKKGDIIVWPIINYDSGEEEAQPIIAEEIHSHHVLFRTTTGRKVSISNFDLVTHGVYERYHTDGNIIPRSLEEAREMIASNISRMIEV